jgi:hypothetical protein
MKVLSRLMMPKASHLMMCEIYLAPTTSYLKKRKHLNSLHIGNNLDKYCCVWEVGKHAKCALCILAYFNRK